MIKSYISSIYVFIYAFKVNRKGILFFDDSFMLYYDTMNGNPNANLAGAYEVCLSDREGPVGWRWKRT
jgi:hypothetical protein